jgi:hypothetical protein
VGSPAACPLGQQPGGQAAQRAPEPAAAAGRGGINADSELAEFGDAEVLDLEEAQTRAALGQTLAAHQSDQQLLERMAEIARAHRHRPDPRIERLANWLKQHLCPGLGESGTQSADLQWQPTRLLIFTDDVDNKRCLERQPRELLGEEEADRRVASFSGGMGEETRERLKARFNADPDQDPLATPAGVRPEALAAAAGDDRGQLQ